MSEENSDAQLVAHAVAGEQRAYELLVIKYQRRITRLAAHMVRDDALAQDVAQETFIRAWRALHQFRGDAQFSTWLQRIAVNTAKQALMQRRRSPIVSEAALRTEDEDESGTSPVERESIAASTPESDLAAREIAAAIQDALQALPEDLRCAITLREIEGLSYDDIALAMNCPIGTVRSRIFRAREAISKRIRPMLSLPGGKRW